jgi:5-formyltetrahydrofolate cyclo-ligase
LESNLTKDNLRQLYVYKRNELSEHEIKVQSEALSKLLFNHFALKGKVLSCFLTMAHKKEIDTSLLISFFQAANKIYVPVSNFQSGEMTHCRYVIGDEIQTNAFGIPEPVIQNETSDPVDFYAVFIPLLVSDKSGNRLGYGKGFYDRFLAQCPPSVLKIGLSFFEPIERIPFETHDIALTHLVTPNHLYKFPTKK